jgi:hypothetical protein
MVGCLTDTAAKDADILSGEDLDNPAIGRLIESINTHTRSCRKRLKETPILRSRISHNGHFTSGILQIERGERSPMRCNVIKIAAALQVDLADLLSGDD